MSAQEQVITLNSENSIQILAQYIELAQQKGAYRLNEAEILKRGMDVLLNKQDDHEINDVVAKNLLIQGVMKGQSHGAYTLNDAALLHKVVQVVSNDLQGLSSPGMSVQGAPAQSMVQPQQQDEDSDSSDDLSDLAEPIPLKPKEI